MKPLLLFLYLASASAAQAAGVAVLDIENLAVAQQVARDTREVVESSQALTQKTDQILQALTGSRDGQFMFPADRFGGPVSVASAPSFGFFVQDDRLNLGSLGNEARRSAIFMINGLMLASALQSQQSADGSTTPANQMYRSRLRGGVLLAALAEQASRNAALRERQISQAAASIGRTADLKGAVDQNSLVQLETMRTLNDLLSVQAAMAAAANAETLADVTRTSQTRKMLQYREVNPFRALATEASNAD